MSENTLICIDKAIKSFSELKLEKRLQSINVHCNEIKELTELQNLSFLKHLDLSSNQLSSLNGLQGLSLLCSLNLASNLITSVSGLRTLVNLRYINLSYNLISSVSELSGLHGQSRLETFELHGNQLKHLDDLFCGFQGLICLKHLVLKLKNADNPICNAADYRETMLNGLPQLLSLDGFGRSGKEKCEQSFNDYGIEPILTTSPLKCIISKCKNGQQIQGKKNIEQPFSRKKQTKKTPVIFDTSHEAEPVNCTSLSDELSSGTCYSSVNQKEKTVLETKPDHSKIQRKNRVQNKNSEIPSMLTAKRDQAKLKQKTRPQKEGADQKNETATNVHLNLMRDLESERERRWKAEQASKKLTHVIMTKQSEASIDKALQNMASDTTERLKTFLLQEKEINTQLEGKILRNRNEMNKLKEELAYSCNTNEQHETSIELLNKKLKCVCAENNKLKSIEKKRVSSLQSELDAVKSKYVKANHDVCQLQTTVAKLENLLTEKNKTREIPEDLMSANINELQHAKEIQLKDANQLFQNKLLKADKKIQVLNKDYKKLENEFREALRMENQRFLHLQSENQMLRVKSQDLESCLKDAVEKDGKSKNMIQDLTSIIKEQKLKFGVTTSSKEDLLFELKTRIKKLEAETEEMKNKSSQVEILKQEKSRLISQVTAMQSVVEGLKEERRQWGKELAQQGSSLAQDRGRMELKIEYLETEILNLQKCNEKDLDALKIKSKVIDDQTQTILKLKEALCIKDKEIKSELDNLLTEQKHLQQIIDDITQENGVLQEEKNSLQIKNEKLKEELDCVNEDYMTLQNNHGKLRTEKVKLLSKLETQVKCLTESTKLQEQKLQREKDSAICAARNLLSKIENNNSLHQEQLEALKIAHADELQRKQMDKDNEIHVLTKQVQEVEGEMRNILKDAEIQKQNYESRMKAIKQTFQEISVNI